MKFNYKFSNLCGCVYKQGNLQFTADGNAVLSPVGNRITVFDLVNHKSATLPFENRKDIAHMALNPQGTLLITVDVDGRALLINFLKRVVLSEFHFKKPVSMLKFSPCGKWIAVTHGRHVQVWKAPGLVTTFRPFQLHRTYTGHYDEVLTIEWSHDSQFFVTGSKDMTARLYSLHTIEGFVPLTLTGHRGWVVGVFFGEETALSDAPRGTTLFTVGKDGALFVWKFHLRAATGVQGAGGLPEEERRAKAEAEAAEESDEDKSEAESDDDDNDENGAGMEIGAVVVAGQQLSNKQRKALKARERSKYKRVHAMHRKYLAGANVDAASLPYLAKGTFRIENKHYFNENHAKVHSVALHRARNYNLLVVGFSSGLFGLYELPDFNNIHTLSMGNNAVAATTINCSGEWLAFGSPKLGQLLVWEWKSETYVLKQQGHFFDVNALSFSPDGQLVATGGDDGKVKLWNASSGFCFVTFHDHTGPVTMVEFSATGTVVLSASSDGTVRAYDLVRYRNFRTLKAPKVVRFTSLTIDPSGEILCAGAEDPFEVYVWSLQTGKLLDVVTGHEGPVSSLSYNAAMSLLASASWDGTVRLWDVFTGKGLVETLENQTDVLCVEYRPDGKELCCATLDGKLNVWDPYHGRLKFSIEGRKDIMGGRRRDDARESKNSTHSTCFTSLCYSADGTCVLAGGNSKWVCIYELSQKILLKKFCITSNLSFDGILEKLNSRYMGEAGSLQDIDADDSDSDVENRLDRSLPGVTRGEFSKRSTPLVARTKCVRFSPTGFQWAAASTEGLLIYSLDQQLTFAPSDLDLDTTPENCRQRLKEQEYSRAMMMALCLNEPQLIVQVLEATPTSEIGLVVRSLPPHRVQALLTLVAAGVGDSPHLQFYLEWVRSILTTHGAHLKASSAQFLSTFRALQKVLTRQRDDIGKLCNSNKYMLEYLTSFRGHDKSRLADEAGENINALEAPMQLEHDGDEAQDQGGSGAPQTKKRSGDIAVAASKPKARRKKRK